MNLLEIFVETLSFIPLTCAAFLSIGVVDVFDKVFKWCIKFLPDIFFQRDFKKLPIFKNKNIFKNYIISPS